jgi:hypothetical protein
MIQLPHQIELCLKFPVSKIKWQIVDFVLVKFVI